MKRERDQRDWSQKELSTKSGVSQSQISIIEGGKPTSRVRAKTLIGLAKHFDINAAALWEGRVQRGFGRGLLGRQAHELDTKLSATNHEKWIAYGQGLLAAQKELEEPTPDPQPGAGEQRDWRAKRRGGSGGDAA